MSVFAIADTHLSVALPKPMDIFGSRWENWTEKLVFAWKNTVTENDTVVIPGDISWGISLEESKEDFKLLDSLPGKKILGRGNHDFWFTTMRKTETFFRKENIKSIEILYNNAFLFDGIRITGCRGWYNDEKSAPKDTEYQKIVSREAGRLELSLSAANKLEGGSKTVCFFHFPPVFGQFVCRELIDILHRHGITECYYGHIHARYDLPKTTEFEGIKFTLISADYLDFRPLKISEQTKN